MRKLLRQIKRELKTAKHCAVYEEELTRVWPQDKNHREPKIARFAEMNGFRLRFYRDGLCAIFDREPADRSEENLSARVSNSVKHAQIDRQTAQSSAPRRRTPA